MSLAFAHAQNSSNSSSYQFDEYDHDWSAETKAPRYGFGCRCFVDFGMPYLLRFKARLSFGVTERPPDMVASKGNSDLDDPEADCQGSDTLVAGDRDDLVGAAARLCWVVVAALR